MSRCEHCGGNDYHSTSCPHSSSYQSPDDRIAELESWRDAAENRVAELERRFASDQISDQGHAAPLHAPSMQAVRLIRAPVGERLRGTRLDILPATGADGDQVWIGDGDRGEVLLKIPASQIGFLIDALQQAQDVLADKPPEDRWYGGYRKG